MARKLQILWTSATAEVIANNNPPSNFKNGTTTFNNVTTVKNMGTFLMVGCSDGCEYGYPQANIKRIKLSDY